MELRDHGTDKFLLLEEKRAIISFFGDSLGTAKVYVHCITVVLDKLGSLQEYIWIVCAELDCKGSILLTWLEVLLAIFRFLGK